MPAYSAVHIGPKIHGGGRRGGCLSAMYVFWLFLAVSCTDQHRTVPASGQRSLRDTAKPTVEPRATGRSMAMAGWEKAWLGSVRDAM